MDPIRDIADLLSRGEKCWCAFHSYDVPADSFPIGVYRLDWITMCYAETICPRCGGTGVVARGMGVPGSVF